MTQEVNSRHQCFRSQSSLTTPMTPWPCFPIHHFILHSPYPWPVFSVVGEFAEQVASQNTFLNAYFKEFAIFFVARRIGFQVPVEHLRGLLEESISFVEKSSFDLNRAY